MRKHHGERELPACYAIVQPGLELVAADEIATDLGGDVRKTADGLVVFRLDEITPDLLRLRTTEDVFLLAWGTDSLTRRALDLKHITDWTNRKVDWQQLLRLHHTVHPKPTGKPTYRLVTQMSGRHVYRRVDAGEALAKGLAGKLPASWKPAVDHAAVEVWLTIQDTQAVCGLRLSDRTMRHRTYKDEHLPASLRPTIAAAMVRVADVWAEQVMLDPMCGVGTIVAEQVLYSRTRGRGSLPRILCGDLDRSAVRAARANLANVDRRLEPVEWDARNLPIESDSVDAIICNPPFGKQLSSPEAIGPLYQAIIREFNRVLRPGGQAVLLVSEADVLRSAIRPHRWQAVRQFRPIVLGQATWLGVWKKPE
jgi:tRNA (guanine6-N2)-methyltransferase